MKEKSKPRTANDKRVIIITGTPGVGKTVISSLLASRLGALHVNLGELVQREKLVCGIDEERKTLIVDMPIVSRRIKEIIGKWKGCVVVDGHYAVNATPSELVSFVFVLRRNPQELKRFLESLGFEARKLWENLAVEILDVCLYDSLKACGQEKVCEIDASSKQPQKVVDEIVSVLEGKSKCVFGFVDWLGELEREGLLEEFLRDF